MQKKNFFESYEMKMHAQRRIQKFGYSALLRQSNFELLSEKLHI